jgi:hypothetical protein
MLFKVNVVLFTFDDLAGGIIALWKSVTRDGYRTEGIEREHLIIIVDEVRSEGRVEFFRVSYFFFPPKQEGVKKTGSPPFSRQKY